MRDIIDGTRLQDLKMVQGIFWATPFQNISGNFALPDDPAPSYVFNPSGGATRTITLPRLIGNTVYGGPNGLTSTQVANGAMNGLFLELINAATVAANLLQAASAAGDGAANIGTTIAVAASASQFTMGQYQVINGAWTRIL